jgi:lipopolysaccharide export system permease protein
MQIQAMSDENGGTLWGLRQYWLDSNQRLVRSVEADFATFDASNELWTLHNVRESRIAEQMTTVENFAQSVWTNAITPQLLANQAFLEPKKMSLRGLNDQINFLRRQQLQATNYQLALWSRLLKPLSYFGLALLALAIVLGPMRSTGLGPRVALGLLVGLTFKYLQDLFAPMAVVFALPAALAVALPIGAYTICAYLLIRRYA